MSGRKAATESVINYRWTTDKEAELQLRREVARSLAVIADALSWQVKQAIEDRSSE